MKIFASILSLASVAFAGIASADGYAESNYARVTSVEPYYVQQTITEYQTVCENVSVPVYRNVRGGADGGDVLAGMIVGGLIGKGISGDDTGAAIGAILGGVSAGEHNRQVHVGNTIERQCYETLVDKHVNVVSHYVIHYSWNGGIYRAETRNQYNVGDRVTVTHNPNF